MGFLRRWALRFALNRRQRFLTWRALLYSAYKFEKRGCKQNALEVILLMNKTEKAFGMTDGVMTEELKNVFAAAFFADLHAEMKAYGEKRYKAGYEKAIEDMESKDADPEPCSSCEHCCECEAKDNMAHETANVIAHKTEDGELTAVKETEQAPTEESTQE